MIDKHDISITNSEKKTYIRQLMIIIICGLKSVIIHMIFLIIHNTNK